GERTLVLPHNCFQGEPGQRLCQAKTEQRRQDQCSDGQQAGREPASRVSPEVGGFAEKVVAGVYRPPDAEGAETASQNGHYPYGNGRKRPNRWRPDHKPDSTRE